MNFDQKMLRLKQELGVTSDKEVAEALDMTKSAMAERKRRNAFPEDKLRALAQQRPELGIDVAYVLSGLSSAEIQEKRRTLKFRLRALRGDRGLAEFAQMLEVAPEEWAELEAGKRFPPSVDLLKRLFERIPGIDPMALFLDAPQRLEGELSHLEIVLIKNYRASSPEGQEMLRRLAANCAEYHSKGNQ